MPPILPRGSHISQEHYALVTRGASSSLSGNGSFDLDAIASRKVSEVAQANLVQALNSEASVIPIGSIFQISDSGTVDDQTGRPIFRIILLGDTANAPLNNPPLATNQIADIPAGGIDLVQIIGYDSPVPVRIDSGLANVPGILEPCGPIDTPLTSGGTFQTGVAYKGGFGLTCLSNPNTTDFPFKAILVVATREQNYEGYLNADLAAPSTPTSVPTTVVATAWIPDLTDTNWPLKGAATAKAFTLVNRTPGFTPRSGSYVGWKMINGEWRITFVKPVQITIHQGVVTTGLATAIGDSWLGAATVVCTEYVDDPTATNSPRNFISGSTGVNVVIREKMTIPTGAYIQWQTITLSNGDTENEFLWAKPPVGGTVHQGITTSAITTANTSNWVSAQYVLATEYTDDPTATNSPRDFTILATNVHVAVRDKILIPSGSYIEWLQITLTDNSIENELIWIKPPPATVFHYGKVTSGLNNPGPNFWTTGPQYITVNEYTDNPSDTHNPRYFALATTGLSVVVRDALTIRKGQYVIWTEKVLADNSIELELVWVKACTFHEGTVTTALTTPVTDPWGGATTIVCTEYWDDPSDSSTPRKYMSLQTGVTVVVRSVIPAIPTTTYVQWVEVELSDGTIENRLTWADC